MANASPLIGDFRGGEWSETAQGNVADPRYKTALAVCFNSLPVEAGAWTRRPGSRHAGITRGGGAARVLDMSFQQSTSYTLEFSDGYLRFRSGATLVTTNDAQTVSAISTANPAVVTTAEDHGWSTGDVVLFPTLGTADPILANRQISITVTDTDKFSLHDAITGTGIDGATLATFTSGTVECVMELVTVYSGSKWRDIRVVQAERTTIGLHNATAPQQISTVTLPTDVSRATFSIAEASLQDGPYYDPIGGGATATPNALNGNITITVGFPAYDSARSYSIGDFVQSSNVNYRSKTSGNVNNTPASSASHWEAVSAGLAVGPNGFQGSDIGRHIRLYSEPSLWVSGATYTAGNVVAYVNTLGATAYYTCLSNHTAGATNAPGVSASTWGINAAGARWTWGKITGLSNIISPGLSGSVIIGNATNAAYAFDGLTNQDSLNAAYKQDTGNPTIISFWEGKNFTGASAQAVGSVTVFPPSDTGFSRSPSSGGGGITVSDLSIIVRAKQTAPSSSSDGTVLGVFNAGATNYYAPVTIASNDTTTTWNYVWVEIVVQYGGSASSWIGTVYCAEIQMFTPTGSGTGTGATVQIIGPALLYTTPVRVWRLGLYSGTTGYPSCGCYHEGRLWLSGAVNNRIDGSVPITVNQQGLVPFFSFAPTESDGTVTDASGIAYTFASSKVNTILWMEPQQQGIVCGTKSGEWLVQATANNNILTPTSIQAHLVTQIGCANIEPTRTDHTVIFAQTFQRKLMEYFPDVYSGKFTAPNLTDKARHLTQPRIAELAYQRELSPVIWARCEDGSLIGASYRRDALMTSQGPAFIGWHWHTLGSSRTVESVCVGQNSAGTLDALTMVTNDTVTGIRHVEVLTDLFEEGGDIEDAWFVDSGIVPTSYAVSVVMGGASGITLNGLWSLNGKTVTVFAGGLDCGDWTVSGGAVMVPFSPSPLQANTLFTSAFVAAFSGDMPIVAGFSYSSRGQIVDPVTIPESGARIGPALGKVKRTHKFAARLVDTQGISFGTRFDNNGLNAATLKSRSGNGTQRLAANELFTGVHFDTVTDEGTRSGNGLCWEITRPFPATVAAVEPMLRSEDE